MPTSLTCWQRMRRANQSKANAHCTSLRLDPANISSSLPTLIFDSRRFSFCSYRYYYCTGCYAAAKAELEALNAMGRERHRGYSLMIAPQVSQANFTLFLPVPSDQPNLEQAKLENSAGATPSAQISQQAELDAVVTVGVQSLRGKGAELRECGVTKLTDVKTGYLLVTWTKGAGSLPQLM